MTAGWASAGVGMRTLRGRRLDRIGTNSTAEQSKVPDTAGHRHYGTGVTIWADTADDAPIAKVPGSTRFRPGNV